MEIKTIDYYGVPLTIHYKIEGKYRSSTYLNPPESPEVYIEEIYAGDVNIFDMLLESQIDEITEKLYE